MPWIEFVEEPRQRPFSRKFMSASGTPARGVSPLFSRSRALTQKPLT